MDDANLPHVRTQPATAVDATTIGFVSILEDRLGTRLRFAGLDGKWVLVPTDWKAHRDTQFWVFVKGMAMVASTQQGAVVDLALALGHYTATTRRRRAAPRRQADTWLAGVLDEAGPIPANHVKVYATRAGLSWPTVKAASKRLGVSKVKQGMKGGWCWLLQHHQEPEAGRAPPPSGCLAGVRITRSWTDASE